MDSEMAEDLGALLPDELWVGVFSYLDSAETLLDVVPRVCKRWRELASRPRSWSSVCVKEDADRVDSPSPKAYARVLLHAPGLRCLKLICSGRTFMRGGGEDAGGKWPESHWLVSALRRCRAVVWEEVRISGYAWLNMPQSGRKSVAELVRRSAPFLRCVHVTLSEDDRNEQTTLEGTDDMSEDEVWELIDSLPNPTIPMMDAVVSLKRVQVLHLDVNLDDDSIDDIMCPQYPYKGELSAIQLPRLRELVIKASFGPTPTTLILDLLRAAAPTLEVLKFAYTIEDWCAAQNPDLPAVVEELSRCTRVHELSVDFHCLPAVSSLPHLKKLELYVWCGEKKIEVVRRVKAVLATCEAALPLRRLRLRLVHRDVVEDDPDGDYVERKCEGELNRFSLRRPDIRVTAEVRDDNGWFESFRPIGRFT